MHFAPSLVSHLKVVDKLLYFHLGLVHACNIFEAYTFTRLAVHDSELGHLQLILWSAVKAQVKLVEHNKILVKIPNFPRCFCG